MKIEDVLRSFNVFVVVVLLLIRDGKLMLILSFKKNRKRRVDALKQKKCF